ncbi:MAG TPA: ImmA/IrrE family metallo-endopeptidase [Allosphingosinicella sp.]
MYSRAETLLLELGITEPSDIRLPVIAQYLGAQVRYSDLESCEARIIGVEDKAIIRVSSRANPRRQRFSIAHEIGHWVCHRGMSLMCGDTDFRPDQSPRSSREATANAFAGKLLLPGYLLDPIARLQPITSFDPIRKIADEFNASYTSTALRLLERRHAPMILISYHATGRRWFKRSIDVPDDLYPPREPPPQSRTFQIINGRAKFGGRPSKGDAAAWFELWRAQGSAVLEDCLYLGDRQVLTLLTFPDQKLLG